jgi:hypothetical protein
MESEWVKIGNEGETIPIVSGCTVRYGSPGRGWSSPRVVDAPTVRAANDIFGDPVVGVHKELQMLVECGVGKDPLSVSQRASFDGDFERWKASGTAADKAAVDRSMGIVLAHRKIVEVTPASMAPTSLKSVGGCSHAMVIIPPCVLSLSPHGRFRSHPLLPLLSAASARAGFPVRTQTTHGVMTAFCALSAEANLSAALHFTVPHVRRTCAEFASRSTELL